jgi:hypothetical protein
MAVLNSASGKRGVSEEQALQCPTLRAKRGFYRFIFCVVAYQIPGPFSTGRRLHQPPGILRDHNSMFHVAHEETIPLHQSKSPPIHHG